MRNRLVCTRTQSRGADRSRNLFLRYQYSLGRYTMTCSERFIHCCREWRLKRFLALVLFAGVAWPQGGTIYQGAMTSSGRNRPSIPITNELINICALLHRRVPTGTIAAQLNISE